MALEVCRVELKEANEFVSLLHRHHDPITGHRFSVGVKSDGKLVGVAICGRPVARGWDKKFYLEVTRCCTDGTKNACSFLYSACARIARDMGFARIHTYVLEEESGTSLRAAGFDEGHVTAGGDWNCKARSGRKQNQPQGPKRYWFKEFFALEKAA